MKNLFFASFLFLLAEFSLAEELINYTITSDSQTNTLEGELEAVGNVVIKSNSGNFEANSDKLSFDKDDKSLKLSDLEKRGIADVNSITKIANDGIGFMKGYKNKLKDGEDKVLAQWIIQNAENGWE